MVVVIVPGFRVKVHLLSQEMSTFKLVTAAAYKRFNEHQRLNSVFSFYIPVVLPFLNSLSFIKYFFAFAKPDFHFKKTFFSEKNL